MNEQDICKDIVKCLKNTWMDQIVFDFTVKIEDESIQCHKFMLVSCSEFFKGLFRSGMREVTDNCVVLNEVSCDVFRLILETIYTGENLLNLGNFVDVWRSVDMLQITFMVSLCENFAIHSLTLDTWENIYINAKILNSKKVLNQLHLFMLKNFEQIRLSPTFLLLSFKEIFDLIESQDLVVNNEDLVLESVIKWVEYAPKFNVGVNDGCSTDEHSKQNKRVMLDTVHSSHSLDVLVVEEYSRKDKLPELLKQVRTCLVSPTVLSRVLQLELFENSKDVIDNALNYNGQPFKHGHLPSAAVPRSCSGYMYGGVIASRDGNVNLISILDNKLFNFYDCENLQEIFQFVNFNGELYAIGKSQDISNAECRMFVFGDKNWESVTTMPSHNLLLVSHGEFIYVFNKDDSILYRVNPKKEHRNLEKLIDFPLKLNLEHAMNFHNFLLVFGSEVDSNSEVVTVYQLDISSKIWTRLDNIEGPAEQLFSFCTDKNHYILQTEGSLSLVFRCSKSEKIEFRFLGKISNGQINVHGGCTYKNKAIIFGDILLDDQNQEVGLHVDPSELKTFTYWTMRMKGTQVTNLVPMSLPTHYLTEICGKL